MQRLGVFFFLVVAACGSKTVTPTTRVLYSNTFNSDPTKQDSNQDGEPDWVIRTAGEAWNPNWINSQGLVLPSFDPILDTNPLQDFPDGLDVTIEMKALTNTSTGWPRGAVFWINHSWTATTAISDVVSLALNSDGTQTLNIIDETGDPKNPVASTLFTVNGLPNDFVKVELHFDTSVNQLELTVNGVSKGKATETPWPLGGTDKKMTLLGWGETAAFASFNATIPK